MSRSKRIVNPIVAGISQESTIIKKTVETVAVRSIFPAHLKYIGLSGQAYEWKEAGAVVAVHPDDVPHLLEKRIGERACCGASGNGNRVFELVE
jgi:hypothetical protein